MDLTQNTFKSIRQLALAGFVIAITATNAFADNQAALKDAIANTDKVAEAKPSDTKATTTAPVAIEAEFKKLDSNNDQKISLKEAVKDKSLAAQFDATDVNHDGLLTADEYAYYKSAAKPMDSAVNPVN
jgi:hypothetical protein